MTTSRGGEDAGALPPLAPAGSSAPDAAEADAPAPPNAAAAPPADAIDALGAGAEVGPDIPVIQDAPGM
jgi:hypothetical protein